MGCSHGRVSGLKVDAGRKDRRWFKNPNYPCTFHHQTNLQMQRKANGCPEGDRALEPKWLSSSRAETVKSSVSTLDQYLSSSRVRNFKVTNETDIRMETSAHKRGH